MAKLSTKARKKLPGAVFAGPDRSYPIEDVAHARNALARAAQHASPELRAEIKAKVRKKYPSIAVEGHASKPRADRAKRHKG
jgi:hypothetical protein